MDWIQGRHEVEQPVFARSDCRFTGIEKLKSAYIATDISGNEIAVKMAKMFGSLARGLRYTGCLKRLDNIWLAWSFQCNFMLKSIL